MKAVIAVVVSLVLHGMLLLALWHRSFESARISAPTLDVRSVVLSTPGQECDSGSAPVSINHSSGLLPAVPSSPDPERPVVEVKALVAPPTYEAEPLPEPEVVVEPLQTSPDPEMRSRNSSAPPVRARIEAGLKDGVTIRPDYPRSARRRGEQGTVTLLLTVDATGKVISAKVQSSPGYKELEESAIKAALSARFDPAECDGHPVASTVILPIAFRLK